MNYAKFFLCIIIYSISVLNLFHFPVFSMEPEGLSKRNSFVPQRRPFSILLIEEGENSLGIYDSETRKETGRIYLNFFPHEIEVTPDGSRAYVSNFGIRDYDMKVGHPGNCISVIDLITLCEVDRLYTTLNGKKYWGPHGLKVHPNGEELYVNVECVNGRYPSSNSPQDSVMLVFNLKEGNVRELRPSVPTFGRAKREYNLLAGTHNFIFTPSYSSENKKRNPNDEEFDMWYYAGSNGVTCIDPMTGEKKRHYPTTLETPLSSTPQALNGAVRGLSCNSSGTSLLVSARNELAIIDLSSEQTGTTVTKFGNLGVGQLFYSKFIPGTNLALAPAARESQVLLVNIDPNAQLSSKDRVIKRIVTGIDPLQVIMSPIEGERVAYVTNANSSWVSELDLETYEERARIPTRGGGNGIAFSKFLPSLPNIVLKLGACLPFSGQFSAEGRECRIGLQFWEEAINKAGGLVVNGKRYLIQIWFGDTGSTLDEEELKTIFTKFSEINQEILCMFGTYPSSANLILSRVLNEFNLPLITSTGRDPSLFKKGFSNVFGISPLKQASDLKDTFMAIYKHVFPKPRTAMILACDMCDSCEEAGALEKYLTENGVQVLSPFKMEKSEPSSIIKFRHCAAYEDSNELKDLNERITQLGLAAQTNCQYYPDMLFIAGHRKEAAMILTACKRENFTYGLIAINTGATSYHFLTQVAVPVENMFGSVCWSEDCSDFAEDRFVSSTDFQRMFYERYSESPSELVAGFAASGVVLETALKKAPHHNIGEGFSADNLLCGLKELDFDSFYGPIHFDERGANMRKPLITVQLRTVESRLKGVTVWPLSVAGKERPKLPFSQMEK